MSGRQSSPGDFDYEPVGDAYSRIRRPDPRIAADLRDALGASRTLLNVGAGAGSYEPDDLLVLAVEPSPAMRSQRPRRAAPAIDATAEQLPFDEDSFDAAMALISVHQWPHPERGLREMRRVSRELVLVMTFDGRQLDRLWLGEYFPELFVAERRRYPAIEDIARTLGGDVDVLPVNIPADCTDGFTEAYYARPEAFLDPEVRRAQSAWAFVSPQVVERGVQKLRDDLASGRWEERHGHLRNQPQFTGALRLIISRIPG